LSVWHLWLAAGIILFIAEVFTPGFVLACIGVGCVLAAIPASLDASVHWQILTFALGTGGGFVGIRPFMMRYLYQHSKDLRTNVDALVGMTGRVTQTIDPDKDSGRALVNGDDWRAFSIDNKSIPVGEKICVVKVEGNKIFVRTDLLDPLAGEESLDSENKR